MSGALAGYTATTLTALGGPTNTVSWTPVDANAGVITRGNGEPSFFCSPTSPTPSSKITGTIKVTGDDDFIGFAIGADSPSSTGAGTFYLIDWKESTQSRPGRGDGMKGMAISKVFEGPSGLDFDEFFVHDGRVAEFQRAATLGNVGWVPNVVYPYELIITPTDIMFSIDVDGNGLVEQFHVAVTPSDVAGSFCFYQLAQGQNVEFRSTTVTPVADNFIVGGDPEPSPTGTLTGYTFLALDARTGSNSATSWNPVDFNNGVIGVGNGEPSFYCSPEQATALGEITGTMMATGDDDFMGFAIGVDNPNGGPESDTAGEFYLIDWKKRTQTFGSGTALPGLAISQVTEESARLPFEDYFVHTGTVSELARATTLGSTGWENSKKYPFKLTITPTNIMFFVDVDGNGLVKQFDIATTSTVIEGSFCFYQVSQSRNVLFEDTVYNRPDSNVGGDPHFKTWKQDHYEYHGQCDLVLAHDSTFADRLGLDIHIRTKLVRYWSYIKAAVIRIGNDVLEIEGSSEEFDSETHYWYNYEYQGEMTEFAGFQVSFFAQQGTKVHKNRIEIDLSSKYPGQKIVLSTFKEFVKVSFENASEESFGNTVGMLGDFKTGKTLARDGSTELHDYTEFGQEWQVLPSDKRLFHQAGKPRFPELCIEPEDPRGERRRRLEAGNVSMEDAEAACSKLDDALDRKDCVYDILATQDMDMAGAY